MVLPLQQHSIVLIALPVSIDPRQTQQVLPMSKGSRISLAALLSERSPLSLEDLRSSSVSTSSEPRQPNQSKMASAHHLYGCCRV